MSGLETLEPLSDPANPMSFLLDWEVTMKCNLDCSYCGTGLYSGGHDNTTKHPPLQECLLSLQFMYQYVDLYMQHKTPSLRRVVLNVYGGESLHHPDIVTILQAAHAMHEEKYNWPLTINVTTNAIVSAAKLNKILPLVDHWTVSYHTENTSAQHQQFKNNLLAIKTAGKSLKCIVLMHSAPALFEDAVRMQNWLDANAIAYLPRALDHPTEWTQFNYNTHQIKWFNKLHKNNYQPVKETTDLSSVGRACCGGRSLCENKNYKNSSNFVSNQFSGWSCSVNWFFLYVKQVTGEIFTNKDCMMNFNNSVGPIGTLAHSTELLTTTAKALASGTMPVITCAKESCWCGLCAPKAKTRHLYDNLITKYQNKYQPKVTA